MKTIAEIKKSTKDWLVAVLVEGVKKYLVPILLVAVVFFSHRAREVIYAFMHDHSLSVIIVGLTGGTLIVASVWTLYFKLRYYPPLRKQDFDFFQLERSLSFEYRDIENYIYRRAVIIQAKRPGLSVYRDKFLWTGNTEPRIVSEIAKHKFKLLEKKGVWQHYEIDLGRTLNPSDVEKTILCFRMNDPQHTFVPFISGTIDEPTEKLILSVRIPPEFGVNEGTCEIAYNMGTKVPLSTEVKKFDYDGLLSWPIPNPRMHHYYELRWEKPAILSIR
jgi:hypothetical protein